MRVRSTAVTSSASQQHEARVSRLKRHDQPAIGVTIPVPVTVTVPVTKKIFKGAHVSKSSSAAFEAASASLSAASARRPQLPETK